MKKIIALLSVIVFCALSLPVLAGDQMPPMEPYKGSQEFERLKGLVGVWQGTHKMGEIEDQSAVEYYLTSNGSALVEKLFPGTSHEMVTIYHDNKGKLSMTHYCAVGNQPQMDLISAEEKSLSFSLAKNSSIDVATEGHMHALTIDFIDEDNIVHHWKFFEKGEKSGESEITLKRVKTGDS